MTVKDALLKRLEESRGGYISGGDLSYELGVSRSAIWKAVSSLREEGYPIGAAAKRGYCLSDSSSLLSEQSINKYLKGRGYSINVFKTLPSTNTYLKGLASQGAPERTVVIAEEQTAGKGQLGRSFFSPHGSGIYMSLLLRPDFDAEKSLFITTSAAVAVARALRDEAGCSAGIKWVNDIYIGGRKVCGILTEASLSLENGGLEYAVLGIGINVATSPDAFPDSIKGTAGSVLPDSRGAGDLRSRLIAHILDDFMELYKNLGSRPFIDEYRRLSILIGKDIFILDGEKKIPARAVDIDDGCRLKARLEDGSIRTLSSGEVSIRLQ